MVRGEPLFAGLRPATGRAHAAWAVKATAGQAGVGLLVPAGFEAYVRMHHRIDADTDLDVDADGNLDADNVDALTTLLADATSTPDECHYALWQGWGWLHPGPMMVVAQDEARVRSIDDALAKARAPVLELVAACPVEPRWGGSDMILFDGPVEAVASIGHPGLGRGVVHREFPQRWWPDDRAWFIGTEIYGAWTYVAGTTGLIDAILASPRWEAAGVEPTDAW